MLLPRQRLLKARQATVRRYDDDISTPSQTSDRAGDSKLGAPVRPTQAPQPNKALGQLLDALRTALGDDDVATKLGSQPNSAKEEL